MVYMFPSHFQNRHDKQRGFSLISMGTHMAIAGLMGTSVYVGIGVVERSAISLSRDLENVSYAVSNYRDRYNALPGDDPRAEGRWTGARSGDGNGLMFSGSVQRATDAFDATPNLGDTAPSETLLVWQHLRNAGLIQGATSESGITSLIRPVAGRGHVLGIQAFALGLPLAVCTANVTARQAVEIDSRIDDGSPARGSVRAIRDTPAGVGAAPDTQYRESDDDRYIVCKSI